MLDPLCVSLGGGWDGLCSPTEVPGKSVRVTEEEGGTSFILSSSSGTQLRRRKQPQSLCAAEGAEFLFFRRSLNSKACVRPSFCC
jgi:hypothetical protein